jgi:hypothetical protein
MTNPSPDIDNLAPIISYVIFQKRKPTKRGWGSPSNVISAGSVPCIATANLDTGYRFCGSCIHPHIDSAVSNATLNGSFKFWFGLVIDSTK